MNAYPPAPHTPPSSSLPSATGPAPSKPPSFGNAAPKKKDNTGTILLIVGALGCVGVMGVGLLMVVVGGVVAYQEAQEQEALAEAMLYGEPGYDPYGYGEPVADPFAAPAFDPSGLNGLGAGAPALEPPVDVHYVPVGDSPTQGPADALVTIVVFADYQCPFCARVQPTIDALRARHGDDLRVVYKNNPLPFHQNAMAAAELALEARAQRGDAAFSRAHAMLYENQRALSRSDLMRYASELSLDRRAVERALDSRRHRARIEEDMALARQADATGTPSFFINGVLVAGAQPIDAFETVIVQQRVLAQSLVDAGVPRAMIYEGLTNR